MGCFLPFAVPAVVPQGGEGEGAAAVSSSVCAQAEEASHAAGCHGVGNPVVGKVRQRISQV